MGSRISLGNKPAILLSMIFFCIPRNFFEISTSSCVRWRGSSVRFASVYKYGSVVSSSSMALCIKANFRLLSSSRCLRIRRCCKSHARSIVSCACTDGMARCNAGPTSGLHVPVGVSLLRILLGYKARRISSFCGSACTTFFAAFRLNTVTPRRFSFPSVE